MARDRIGTAFHETFALNLAAIAAVLRVCDEHDGDLNPETIRQESDTTLGPNYVTSMTMYARGTGLLEVGSYKLSPLGRIVRACDPNLMKLSTLWMMHYHLSAPIGPGPGFWNYLVSNTIRIGATMKRSDVSRVISDYVERQVQKRLAQRTLDGTATAFLGTYQKSDSLGRLGLIRADENGSAYEIIQPEIPPLHSVACALTYYWEDVGPAASELLLKDLASQEGFAGLFFLGSGMLGALLSELQSIGYVTVRRDAPPFVVARNWTDPQDIRSSMYASE